ncbi:hypothetical protein A2U01_0001824 [Trifolium medium]|uniref:Uncharacterized protein n=1 Tax=Trifolium medium TaxID=97028 RepID=A0A392M1A1_9FABA|nr:hypothetical protein [Trifolium medium]
MGVSFFPNCKLFVPTMVRNSCPNRSKHGFMTMALFINAVALQPLNKMALWSASIAIFSTLQERYVFKRNYLFPFGVNVYSPPHIS